ncbi:MAG: protein kinase [Acidobacteria bacterium]|nr:protein kinase [Acidobacteriota bacterium]
MDKERWRKVEEIFQDVAESEPAKRSALLAEICDGDEAMRREVESLLAHEVFDTFIQQPIKGMARSLASETERDLIGIQLGHYRITDLIGEGGMGAVYAAARDDQLFNQKVAVKVVKRGMDSGFVLSRFQAERRILASLDHPNIARLIDGGSMPDGRPYFVMEFIEGQPLNEYCSAKALSIPDRIHLFRQICSAVQYAHQKLIAHRDIKPSNILVTGEGVPKLLDFGIAKLLDPTQSDADPARTATMMRMMTPDYASPEQVRGLQITTATDIYSLGAVLYELLTGARAHRLETYTPTEIERVVCETEIDRPSHSAATGKHGKLLRGDLDNIILMAMRKEPARRYPSVEQFSDDLRRHLEKLPVQARPDTIRYRTGKFVRRNRTAVGAAAIVLLSLTAGLIVANYQARRAERRFQQVRKLANTFLFDFHDKIQNLPGATGARELVAQTGLEYLNSLAQEAGDDPALLLDLAQAYMKVGDVQGDPWTPNLGHSVEAMQSYQRSLALAQKLSTFSASNQQVQRLLANDYFKIGALQSETGDKRGAREILQQSLNIGEPLAQSTGDAEDLKLLINAYTRFGDTQLDTGDAPGALESYRRAQQLAKRAATAHPSIDSKGRWGNSFGHLGESLVTLGDPEGAIRQYRQGADILEKLVDQEPTVRQRRDVRVFYTWLGNLYGNPNFINIGDQKTALEYYERALKLAEAQAAVDPRNARARLDLAVSYAGMGDVELEMDAQRGAEYFRKALDVAMTLLRESPENYSYLRRREIYLTKLATVQMRLGDRATAMRNLRQAQEILAQLTARDPADAQVLGDQHANLQALAELHLQTGEYETALEYYRQTLTLAETCVAASRKDLYAQWRLAEAYAGLARCHAAFAARLSGGDQTAGQQQVCEWRRKELTVWDDWGKVGVSSVFDQNHRELAARAVAKCEARLNRLTYGFQKSPN